MCSRLGPIKIRCDAPPYAVVRACKGRGFQSPLDVGWCRLGHVNNRTTHRRRSFWIELLQLLFGASKPKEQTCACGQPLPDLKQYHFAVSEEGSNFLLGQCSRCRTMLWDVAVPLPVWMDDGILE